MKLNGYQAHEINQADSVIAALAKIGGKAVDVKPYENGRENGYTVTAATGNAATFSENRNSDDIVVYWGDFHTDPDGLWNNRTFFGFGKFSEAAKAIAKHLQTISPAS
jgi:formylmethanofuran dehydrogenase subunit B